METTEKMKQPKEDWKDFLHLSYDTYWTYQAKIAEKLWFKNDFPTFPVSVGDFICKNERRYRWKL
ncbi:12081_t:CDS:2, partial [Rhizophagus irregularis]